MEIRLCISVSLARFGGGGGGGEKRQGGRGELMETEVQDGVCYISWPRKGKINTKQRLHSSVRYLAHPGQELTLLPPLTGNYCAYEQPPHPPSPGQANNGPANPHSAKASPCSPQRP